MGKSSAIRGVLLRSLQHPDCRESSCAQRPGASTLLHAVAHVLLGVTQQDFIAYVGICC